MRSLSFPGPPKAITDSPNYKWWAYATVAVGLYVSVVDQSGVSIAAPDMADYFQLDIPTVQWVLLSYILTTAATFMPVGHLSDMLGRKSVYLVGFLLFGGGAAVGAAAQSFPMLIGAKVIQGIGAAGIQANGITIITTSFPAHERGKAIGMYTTIIGSGLISGPIIGGFLVDALGWRAFLFLSVPLSVLALASGAAVLKEMGSPKADRSRGLNFDWLGAGLSSGALASFLLGMSNGHRYGWGSPLIVLSFVIAPVLLMTFLWWELRTKDPMLDLSLFRNRLFSMGMSTRTLLFLTSGPVYFLIPFYLINGLLYSPDKAGLMMVPSAACMSIVGPFSGRLSDRLGTRWITFTGLASSAAGMFMFSRLSLDSSLAYIIGGLVLFGVGGGIFHASNSTAVFSSQPRERYGITSALLNLFRTSGNVAGVAISTTIVAVTMGALGYEPSLAAVSGVGGAEVRSAFVSGLDRAYLSAGILLVLALILSSLHGAAPNPGRVPRMAGAAPARGEPGLQRGAALEANHPTGPKGDA